MPRKIICVLLSIMLMALLGGCDVLSGEVEESKNYNLKESYVESGVLAENGGLTFEWDAERFAMLIKRDGNIIWASMPIDQYTNNTYGGAVKRHIESHLLVEYNVKNTNDITTVPSYIGAIEEGKSYTYKIDNGIRIVYCFDALNIKVPVEYRLVDGYLDVDILTKLLYDKENKIAEIALLPYAGGLENVAENKIFVPDGSGMVMYCDTEREVRNYNEFVYGQDLAEATGYKFIYSENVKMPIFAISRPTTGTYLTIVDTGETAAEIVATAGDTTIGYSYAYANFKVRGSQQIQIPEGGWGAVSVSAQYSKKAFNMRLGMRIVFLDEADQSFVNVANAYRDYLIKEKGMSDSGLESEPTVYLDIPMSLSQRKFFFGFPKQVMESITTYDQTADILDDFVNNTGVTPTVRLTGIQSGGLDIGQIAGGFDTESVLGNKKKLNALLAKAEDLGATLYPEFDIVRYKESGSGFSKGKDSIEAATSMKAIQYFHSISTGVADDEDTYFLLSPKKLNEASEKLLSMLDKKGFSTVALSTIGSSFYSDYAYEDCYLGRGFINTFNDINKSFSKNKVKLMYDSANQYAAVKAACIINSPTGTSNFQGEDEWIPLYQMVFKGYVPMSSASVSVVNDRTTEVLRSIQCGTGLMYTACGKETGDYANSNYLSLVAGSYDNIKKVMFSEIEFAKKASDKTEGAKITGFAKVADGVCRTTFDNGVSITVNYNTTDYNDGTVQIPAQNYIVEG